MKITVYRSAKNSARCQRRIAVLNLIIEADSLSYNFRQSSENNKSKNFKLQLEPSLSAIN